MAGMNKGLQKHTEKKKLRNRGINPESSLDEFEDPEMNTRGENYYE